MLTEEGRHTSALEARDLSRARRIGRILGRLVTRDARGGLTFKSWGGKMHGTRVRRWAALCTEALRPANCRADELALDAALTASIKRCADAAAVRA